MKIAMIGQKGIPSKLSGIEIHIAELSRRLVFLGYEMELYSKTHTFTSTIKALMSNCDVFHYHALGPSTLSFIPRIFGKKVVCTVHGLDWQRGELGRWKSHYLKFGEYATVRFAHKTINVSKNLVNYYREKYDVKTEYIPNGIERPDILKPNIIRQKYNLEPESYILFLTRLVPEKGVHYLIDAYKSIATNKKLVIAGESTHSAHYKNEIQRMAKNNKNIIFTGYVRDQELAELLSNAYLYVLPSDIEGLSISLLEAMSYGNCCLVSDIPENTDVVSTMGYSFEKANVTDLVSKLNLLLQNESKVSSVKRFAGDYIIKKYNWDQITVKTSNIYKSLFNRNKSKKLKAKDAKNHKTLTSIER